MSEEIKPPTCAGCSNPITDMDKMVQGYCCSGHMCGCMGLPISEPFCSQECADRSYEDIAGYVESAFPR